MRTNLLKLTSDLHMLVVACLPMAQLVQDLWGGGGAAVVLARFSVEQRHRAESV